MNQSEAAAIIAAQKSILKRLAALEADVITTQAMLEHLLPLQRQQSGPEPIEVQFDHFRDRQRAEALQRVQSEIQNIFRSI